MSRLLFTVPVSNAKLERMLTKLKRAKINFRCSLGFKCLEKNSRIIEEGSNWETFDPISAIKKWSIAKVRRASEKEGLSSYKSRNSAEVNIKSLSDDDNYDEEENIYENGDEEEYFFLLIPSKIFFCS